MIKQTGQLQCLTKTFLQHLQLIPEYRKNWEIFRRTQRDFSEDMEKDL